MSVYPQLRSALQIEDWVRQMVSQLERDREESRKRFGVIVEPTVSSNTVELDLAKGDTFIVTLDQNLTTINVIEPRATDEQRYDFMLVLQQDGTGSRTAGGLSAFLWAGGSAPTVTSTASAIDIFEVTVIDRAMYARTYGQDMS